MQVIKIDPGCKPELTEMPNTLQAFQQAVGGVWKLEAKRNIADYFASHLADLIDAGQVVVMQ